MNLILRSCLLGLLVMCSSIAANSPDSDWRDLARSGKGVVVAKFKNQGRTVFVFFPGANRKTPTSHAEKIGVVRPSLDEAVKFVRQKPPEIALMACQDYSVIDDAKLLVAFTGEELKALGLQ